MFKKQGTRRFASRFWVSLKQRTPGPRRELLHFSKIFKLKKFWNKITKRKKYVYIPHSKPKPKSENCSQARRQISPQPPSHLATPSRWLSFSANFLHHHRHFISHSSIIKSHRLWPSTQQLNSSRVAALSLVSSQILLGFLKPSKFPTYFFKFSVFLNKLYLWQAYTCKQAYWTMDI